MAIVVLSIYLAIYLSSYLSIYLSLYLSIYLSTLYLSFCKLESKAILRDFLSFWFWQHRKCSNSARHPPFSKVTTSKTQQFCETSSIFEVDNIKNETILWDFLQTWKLFAELRASCHCVLRFFHFTCLKYCACHEKVMPGHTKCCTCHAKSSQQTWRSDAPRCKAPGPPNSSDEHVSCTAPATENASLQIFFKWPTPCYKTFTLCSLLTRCTIPCACCSQNDIWRCKSGPNMKCF